MSDFNLRDGREPAPATGQTREKSPAPDLNGRAPRPPVVRLRRSVVQILVIGAGVLLAGSLAWAFVVQPEMRDLARARAVEAREEPNRGAVRPAEIVTDQPASYDRLPDPRSERPADVEAGTPPPPPAPSRRTGGAGSGAGVSARTDTRSLAVRSSLFFEGETPRPSAASTGATARAPAEAPAGLIGARSPIVAPADRDGDAVYNRHSLTAPRSPYEVKAGSIVSAVLLTGVDTSRPGAVIATVTENIYDTVTGRHLLAPQGSRLLGRHEGDSSYGDRRAFLSWERLILPNGKSLVLDGEPGVDAQGTVGLRGRVDRRLGALATGTLFAGAITTLGQMARDDGGRGEGSFLGDAGDAAAIEGARVGGRLIDRELEVRPAIRIEAGGQVRVLITRDLVLEPYQP